MERSHSQKIKHQHSKTPKQIFYKSGMLYITWTRLFNLSPSTPSKDCPRCRSTIAGLKFIQIVLITSFIKGHSIHVTLRGAHYCIVDAVDHHQIFELISFLLVLLFFDFLFGYVRWTKLATCQSISARYVSSSNYDVLCSLWWYRRWWHCSCWHLKTAGSL